MKTEIKWGLIFVFAGLAWVTLERVVGLHDQYIHWHPYLSMLFFFPAVALYVLALREKRSALGGKITYKQAVLSGLLITVIVTALSPLSQWITHKFITPNYFQNVIAYSVKAGMLTLEQAQANFNLSSYIRQASLGALFAGLLTTLIVAFFVRTKQA